MVVHPAVFSISCNSIVTITTLLYSSSRGIPLESRYTYTGGSGVFRDCKTNVVSPRYYCSGFRTIVGEAGMMQSIMRDGPIVATMTVFEDFFHYKNGIYSRTFGNRIGAHIVKIVGWSERSNGNKYWIVFVAFLC